MNADPSHQMKSCMFVDFDNIFSGLQRLDSEAAEAFAREPKRWLDWLRNEYGFPYAPAFEGRRSILQMRCYLNPAAFGRFRANFVRAGFEVIDCPPLTSGGKTSADIHIVLGVMDALEHPTHFDEFLILSGDADFTPVLVKLRAHDRRTVVLSPQFSAPAFRATCDALIGDDLFVERGLGFEAEPKERARSAVAVASLAPLLSQPDPESVREWRIRAGDVIARLLADSARPISSATVATVLRRELADHGFKDWEAVGDFKGFISGIEPTPFAVDWAVPGWFFDPLRHAAPARAERDLRPSLPCGDPTLVRLAADIHRLTDVPLLTSVEYAMVFHEIANYVDEHGPFLSDVSKVLGDRFPKFLSRADATFIVRGISTGGYRFARPNNVRAMAEAFLSTAIELSSQLDLDTADFQLMREWILDRVQAAGVTGDTILRATCPSLPDTDSLRSN